MIGTLITLLLITVALAAWLVYKQTHEDDPVGCLVLGFVLCVAAIVDAAVFISVLIA